CPFDLFASESDEIEIPGENVISGITVEMNSVNIFDESQLEFLKAIEEVYQIPLLPKSPPTPEPSEKSVSLISEKELQIEIETKVEELPENVLPIEEEKLDLENEKKPFASDQMTPFMQLFQSLQQPSTNNNALLFAAAAMLAASAVPSSPPNSTNIIKPEPETAVVVPQVKSPKSESGTQTSMLFIEKPPVKQMKSIGINTSTVFQSPFVNIKHDTRCLEQPDDKFSGKQKNRKFNDNLETQLPVSYEIKEFDRSTLHSRDLRREDVILMNKQEISMFTTNNLQSHNLNITETENSFYNHPSRSEINISETQNLLPLEVPNIEGPAVPFFKYGSVNEMSMANKTGPLGSVFDGVETKSVFTSVSRQIPKWKAQIKSDSIIDDIRLERLGVEEEIPDDGMLTLSFLDVEDNAGADVQQWEKGESEKRIYIPRDTEFYEGDEDGGLADVSREIAKIVKNPNDRFVMNDTSLGLKGLSMDEDFVSSDNQRNRVELLTLPTY
ncbi:hypothetical protein HK096_002646, partial [Nowakowskiella sp. JEL0078]